MLLNKKKTLMLTVSIVVFILFTIYLSQTALAQTRDVSEIRRALRRAMFYYFRNPSGSQLSVDELKDLLSFYLSIPAEQTTTDASGEGANSGSSYETIIDEADAVDIVIPRCRDGVTEYGKCAIIKPRYCYSGNFLNRCDICGCPAGKTCENSTGRCAGQWDDQTTTTIQTTTTTTPTTTTTVNITTTSTTMPPGCIDGHDESTYCKSGCGADSLCHNHKPYPSRNGRRCNETMNYDTSGDFWCYCDSMCKYVIGNITRTCDDPDGGLDYYTKTVVYSTQDYPDGSWQEGNHYDGCSYSSEGTQLREWYCDGKNAAKSKLHTCRCFDGVCVPNPTTTTTAPSSCVDGRDTNGYCRVGRGADTGCDVWKPANSGYRCNVNKDVDPLGVFWCYCDSTCRIIQGNVTRYCDDPDGGLDYYTKTTVTFDVYYPDGSERHGGYYDTCVSSTEGNQLSEYYCDVGNNAIKAPTYTCPNSCLFGVCT
jgi:hypothetical protein